MSTEAMTTLNVDRFTEWVCEASRGCMSDEELEQILEGEFDITGDGKFYFKSVSVQAQWEAWQAAIASTVVLRDMATSPNDGTPILVKLERESLSTKWHVARIHPNVKFVGHYFAYDCPKMVGWLPLQNDEDSESEMKGDVKS